MAEIGIPASLLQRYFSAYGAQSPLEAAITPEKVQGALSAIGQFQDTRKAQAEQKLLQANIPEGAGNMPIKSFADLMAVKKLEGEREKRNLEYSNEEAEKIHKYNAAYSKFIQEQADLKREWAFKLRRQEETEKHNRAMEAKKDTGGDFIAPGASTGTVKTDPLGIR